MSTNEHLITLCGHGSGTPSYKNMYDYLEHRYGLIAPNGVRKGLVAVRRLREMDDAGRTEFVKNYSKIIGRNEYSQAAAKRVCCYAPYKDGKYYSDCSSSGCATYKLTYPLTPMTNTAGIYTKNKYWETVDCGIVNGHVRAPEALKVGDALLFAGDNPSRVLQIGHVEYVYKIDQDPEDEPTEKLQTARNKASKYNRSYEATGNVNIRTGAGTIYKSLGVIPKGRSARCYGFYNTFLGRDWLLVQAVIDGRRVTGYVSSKYLA